MELLKVSSAANLRRMRTTRRVNAMDKLHDANKDAWDAIEDAHRTDRSS